ncbi:hypothetical protein JCM11641_001216 [Rhodosporidiobolus odoratus]
MDQHPPPIAPSTSQTGLSSNSATTPSVLQPPNSLAQPQVQTQQPPQTNQASTIQLDSQGHTPAGVTAASLLPSRDQIPR